MNAQELAALINQGIYVYEELAQENGLLLVYGGDKNELYFRGLINDELDCQHEEQIYLGVPELYPQNIYLSYTEDGDPYPTPNKIIAHAPDLENDTWQILVDFPCSPFNLFKDGKLYCRGFVANQSDLKPFDTPISKIKKLKAFVDKEVEGFWGAAFTEDPLMASRSLRSIQGMLEEVINQMNEKETC